MSTLDKIVDRIPYSDGGFRRRMTGGSIVTVAIGITAWGLFGSQERLEYIASSGIGNVMYSPAILALLLVIIHAIGGTIEVFAELFVARIAGNMAWSVQRPRVIVAVKFRAIRGILSFIYFALLPFFSMYGLVCAFFGKSLYNWNNIKDHLSKEAVTRYDSFPHIVRQSLKDPFGKRRAFLWIYFGSSDNSNDGMALTRRLDSRNHDLLSVITSVMILPVISSFYLVYSWVSGSSVEEVVALFVLAFYLLSFAIYILLYGYIMMIRQSIVTIIEFSRINSLESLHVEGDDSEEIQTVAR